MSLTVLFGSLIPLGIPPATQAGSHAYSNGTTNCIQGVNGPGLALYLGSNEACVTAIPPHPYLEIDVRELPVPIGKVIAIGPTNWAFRCPSSRESCGQALSGTVALDRAAYPSREGARSTGRYQLKFREGQVEEGEFEITCSAPCA